MKESWGIEQDFINWCNPSYYEKSIKSESSVLHGGAYLSFHLVLLFWTWFEQALVSQQNNEFIFKNGHAFTSP